MKMISQLSHVMTLANSVIGVSVLAMPFCFKQCGIVLAALVLLLCSLLSRLACHFLVKSAVMSRRRNFELLAFHSFGHMGKFLVELFIIGFLVGTCIAFFVVMGDLGPQIVGKMIDKNPEDIRTSLLITTSVFIVLPLGLLRNIDSLSSICTATIVFYLCLVLKVIAESMQHIFAGDWYEHVYYWRPSGILQCLPIFSMALFCQTQLFEIYETIPNVSLEKMNQVVRGALNICTIVYLCVGFFGYIAFCTQPFTGNILMSFEPSLSSEMIKMGFVFSVAFSFPLVIFPCRASLNSLLFRRVYTHEPSMNYLPETRFKCLTITIVSVALITGILIPNIEFVLGLVGSTIGVMICLIFPAIFFISISSKHTNERLLAQGILFVGICIMILGTYANLYAMEESTNTKASVTTNKPLSQINNLPLSLNKDDIRIMANIPNNPGILPDIKDKMDQLPDLSVLDKTINAKAKDVRQEPPIPVERIVVTEKQVVETQRSVENIVATFAPEIKKIVEKIKTMDQNINKESDIMPKIDAAKPVESITLKAEQKINSIEQKERSEDIQKNEIPINSDAIKKEESELAADAEAANLIAAERREELRKTLEKHKLEQMQMMKEQKEILKEIKQWKQETELEEKRMAKNIEEKNKQKKVEAEGVKDSERLKKDKDATVLAKDVEVINDKKIHDNQDKMRDAISNEAFDKTKDKDSNNRVLDNTKASGSISKRENEENLKDARDFLPAQGNSDTLNNSLINEQKIEKSAAQVANSVALPKGPILNVLTKRTSQKSVVAELNKNDSNREVARETNEILENVVANPPDKAQFDAMDQRMQHKYSLPIALKMRNQTKIDNASVQLLVKNEENVQAARRDILENHEREKRDVDVTETNAKVASKVSDEYVASLAKNYTGSQDHENCAKSEKNVDLDVGLNPNSQKESEPNLSQRSSTEASIIKTNIYLTEQEVANAISVDPNIAVRGEFIKVKQRDLKALDTGGNGDTRSLET